MSNISNSGHLTTQYNLRWTEELKEKVSDSAKEHNRSMNADIVARLESSFSKGDPLTQLQLQHQIVDVELMIMGGLPDGFDPLDFQNLIIQCPVSQIPNKGDFVTVAGMNASGWKFEVKRKIYDVSFGSEHGYTLIVEVVMDSDWNLY